MEIGFMQGRLSPLVDGRIQAFPRDHWKEEFALAEKYGFAVMEWTLDQEGLHANPLMTVGGRGLIRQLSRECRVSIPSVTGDCFMQSPFFKLEGQLRDDCIDDFRRILDAAVDMDIQFIVFPLVDDGRIENSSQEADIRETLVPILETYGSEGPIIAFESDYPPEPLGTFIAGFPVSHFGINYDIGNSAANDFDPIGEFAVYGRRVVNVHVKDRPVRGTTVPLGEGAADFPAVLGRLADCRYDGNLILQTARAADGDHAGALVRYRDMVRSWLEHA